MYKSPTYVIADWNIVNNKEYNKYKNKVNIISANYYSVVVDLEARSPEEDLIKSNQIIVNCETKKYYISIKYNPNFIVTAISDTE